MQGKMLIYRPFNAHPEVQSLDKAPDLNMLQKAVGGSIELVPGFDTIASNGAVVGDKTVPCVAFCDEEGKLNGKPHNTMATVMWDKALRREGGPGLMTRNGTPADILVGDVAVIIGDKELLESL